MQQYFSGLAEDLRNKFLNTKLTIYICEGTESEIKEWFKTINIAGVPLNDQELLNAIHSGPFVTLAKQTFSNSRNSNIQKWAAFISGSVNRQDFLKTALLWISKGNIDSYMSAHRFDTNIDELKAYFDSVIEWADSLFSTISKEMSGLYWGQFYEKFHETPYNIKELNKLVDELYEDPYVTSKRGIYEYVLGGKTDSRLLNIRVFDEKIKQTVYKKQTEYAKKNNTSNCPLCSLTDDANNKRIYRIGEMEADHVSAWSKGGETSIENCQMLCKTHNRIKGNS